MSAGHDAVTPGVFDDQMMGIHKLRPSQWRLDLMLYPQEHQMSCHPGHPRLSHQTSEAPRTKCSVASGNNDGSAWRDPSGVQRDDLEMVAW